MSWMLAIILNYGSFALEGGSLLQDNTTIRLYRDLCLSLLVDFQGLELRIAFSIVYIVVDSLLGLPRCESGNVSRHIFAILIIFLAKTLSKAWFFRQREVEHVYDKEYDRPNANSQ